MSEKADVLPESGASRLTSERGVNLLVKFAVKFYFIPFCHVLNISFINIIVMHASSFVRWRVGIDGNLLADVWNSPFFRTNAPPQKKKKRKEKGGRKKKKRIKTKKKQ